MIQPNSSGFSVVELMVVVAVIGVLAVIALPQYAQYKARSRDAARLNALASMSRALVAHYTAERKWPSNPIPGVSCTHDDRFFGAVTYSPDCLVDLFGSDDSQFLDPIGNDPSSSYNGGRHTIYFYSYADQAVLMTPLEVPKNSPCSLPGFTWCDKTNPAHANHYCICIPNPE